MLRVNLMADADFRDDILKMIRSILRDVGYSVIVETIQKENWLQDRVTNYLSTQPIYKVVESYLRQNTGWYQKPEFLGYVEKTVKEQIEVLSKKLTDNVASMAKSLISESIIRDIVKDELKKRFS